MFQFRLLLACFSLVALSTMVPAQSSPEESPPYRGLDANLYMQTSGEYRAACYQAYRWAEYRLREAIAETTSDPRPPAVVMDLDETVLNNGGFQSWMLRTQRAYQQHAFDIWEQHGGDHVTLVPGAKEFVLAAESMGVTVVHISNRNDRYREFTKATLQKMGIPITDDSQLKLSSDTSDKTTRRAEVEQDDNLRIVLYVGDNLRDFDEKYKMPHATEAEEANPWETPIAERQTVVDADRAKFGSEYIILPNPAYGEWAKAFGRGPRDVDAMPWTGDRMSLAFWNVENLFDTFDDPEVPGDEEFTPEGPNRWSEERLEIKLKNLTTVIRKMNDGRGPDILGVAEIENRSVLEMLIQRLDLPSRNYAIVHQDSPSGRGIDCAILYDQNAFEQIDAAFHHVDAEDTRDIVEATFRRAGRDLTVFVNHWPARSHAESFRIEAARTLRARVDEILRVDPLADLVAMGDFNDHPEDPSLTETLRTVTQGENVTGDELLNTTAVISSGEITGTYVYNNKWEILDQIFVSPGMLIPGGVSWGLGSTRPAILANDQLYRPGGRAIARPSRSYTRQTFHANGYSDHLPLVTNVFWDSAAARKADAR